MNNYTKIGIVSIFCAGTTLLSGCGSGLVIGSTKPNFDTDFTVNADIVCERLSAKASITRCDSSWQFAFTEPKSLAGVTLKFDESSCTGGLGAISFDTENSSEYISMPEIIAASVDSLSKCTNDQIVQNDEILTYNTEFNTKTVTVTASAKDGSLIGLKCPYHKLVVNFSDLKPYKKPVSEPTSLDGE